MKKKIGVLIEVLMKIMGIGISLFGLIGLSVYIFDRSRITDDKRMSGIVLYLVFLGFGIFLYSCGKNKRTLRNKAEVYRMCLSDSPEALLSDIARKMNIPTEQVVSELKQLINGDYIENIYIDMDEGRVKMLSGNEKDIVTYNNYVSVKCDNCGATCQVVKNDSQWVCSYCSAMIPKK